MKHTIFRYIAIAATLLAAAVNASAQYNITNGVGTSKKATQIDAETYTIRLETFATGTTTVTETDTPVNVVLVLDVSGSMAWPKGDYSQSTKTSYSYNDIVEGDMEYFRKYSTSSSYIEKIFGEKVVEEMMPRMLHHLQKLLLLLLEPKEEECGGEEPLVHLCSIKERVEL